MECSPRVPLDLQTLAQGEAVFPDDAVHRRRQGWSVPPRRVAWHRLLHEQAGPHCLLKREREGDRAGSALLSISIFAEKTAADFSVEQQLHQLSLAFWCFLLEGCLPSSFIIFSLRTSGPGSSSTAHLDIGTRPASVYSRFQYCSVVTRKHERETRSDVGGLVWYFVV